MILYTYLFFNGYFVSSVIIKWSKLRIQHIWFLSCLFSNCNSLAKFRGKKYNQYCFPSNINTTTVLYNVFRMWSMFCKPFMGASDQSGFVVFREVPVAQSYFFNVFFIVNCCLIFPSLFFFLWYCFASFYPIRYLQLPLTLTEL